LQGLGSEIAPAVSNSSPSAPPSSANVGSASTEPTDTSSCLAESRTSESSEQTRNLVPRKMLLSSKERIARDTSRKLTKPPARNVLKKRQRLPSIESVGSAYNPSSEAESDSESDLDTPLSKVAKKTPITTSNRSKSDKGSPSEPEHEIPRKVSKPDGGSPSGSVSEHESTGPATIFDVEDDEDIEDEIHNFASIPADGPDELELGIVARHDLSDITIRYDTGAKKSPCCFCMAKNPKLPANKDVFMAKQARHRRSMHMGEQMVKDSVRLSGEIQEENDKSEPDQVKLKDLMKQKNVLEVTMGHRGTFMHNLKVIRAGTGKFSIKVRKCVNPSADIDFAKKNLKYSGYTRAIEFNGSS
jgi:hypothetical protein